ncbi:PA14 domain-containing protein [Micromonospora cremea]|uniref:PA14 domain-containing protein n=1 Tax=Micromonospora cremea TaxID=709881 RepID=UPI001FCA51F0|nr:PA14 domain-containing protein [Micromonospora cremea]
MDKLMSTINWTSTADFGFDNYFVSQVLGNITTTQAGSYTFRLSSDDGSKLSIDNSVVINHDGLHGATRPRRARSPSPPGCTRCASTTSSARVASRSPWSGRRPARRPSWSCRTRR